MHVDTYKELESSCLERADRLLTEGVKGDRGVIASMIFEAVLEALDASRHVHVLAIDHKHGTNITVHRSEKDARGELDEYARQWWHQWTDGDPFPDDGTGPESYFALTRGTESYILVKTDIQD